MLQHNFTGPTAQEFLLTLCPSSLDSLKPFTSTLSVLLNEQGGIIDDTIITKHTDSAFYVVTNAGRSAEDKAHISQKLEEWNAAHKGQEVKWETLEGWGLLALQGPKAKDVLQRITDQDLNQVKFGSSVFADIKTMDGQTVKCHVARGGYTGEDGFEVRSCPFLSASHFISPLTPSLRYRFLQSILSLFPTPSLLIPTSCLSVLALETLSVSKLVCVSTATILTKA